MSSKPSKVRKRVFTSPSHIISTRLSSSLSEDLRAQYHARSLRVRKGDTVKVMKGEYKGVEGKVTGLDLESGRVIIEGVTREKIAGGTVPVKIHASKVIVVGLNLDDKWRKEKLEGRGSE